MNPWGTQHRYRLIRHYFFRSFFNNNVRCQQKDLHKFRKRKTKRICYGTNIFLFYFSRLFYFFFVFHIRITLRVLWFSRCARWCIFDFCQLLAQSRLWVEAQPRYELCRSRTNISKLSRLSLIITIITIIIIIIIIIVATASITNILYTDGYRYWVLFTKRAFI